ncbi:hypothetical protein BH23THE1_BH23THE1_27390 [soil metagenome]
MELIRRNGNETNVYGPDFSGTGAYHIDAPFLEGNRNYTIRAEVTSVNSIQPKDPHSGRVHSTYCEITQYDISKLRFLFYIQTDIVTTFYNYCL